MIITLILSLDLKTSITLNIFLFHYFSKEGAFQLCKDTEWLRSDNLILWISNESIRYDSNNNCSVDLRTVMIEITITKIKNITNSMTNIYIMQ